MIPFYVLLTFLGFIVTVLVVKPIDPQAHVQSNAVYAPALVQRMLIEHSLADAVYGANSNYFAATGPSWCRNAVASFCEIPRRYLVAEAGRSVGDEPTWLLNRGYGIEAQQTRHYIVRTSQPATSYHSGRFFVLSVIVHNNSAANVQTADRSAMLNRVDNEALYRYVMDHYSDSQYIGVVGNHPISGRGVIAPVPPSSNANVIRIPTDNARFPVSAVVKVSYEIPR